MLLGEAEQKRLPLGGIFETGIQEHIRFGQIKAMWEGGGSNWKEQSALSEGGKRSPGG